MLILTRRIGESVMVGDDIVITVLDVRGDGVRIGVRAPRSVPVHREEVFEQVQQANRAAAAAPADVETALGRAVADRAVAESARRSKPQ